MYSSELSESKTNYKQMLDRNTMPNNFQNLSNAATI